MGYPNHKNKHSKDSLFTPDDFLNYRKKIGLLPDYPIPQHIILIYQKSLMDHILSKYKTERLEGLYRKSYLIKDTENRTVVLGDFGIGAPVVVSIFEELIAFGAKKFISIGTSGTLQKNLHIGDLVVCDRAIRDEGTSHHYLPCMKYSYASPRATEGLITALTRRGRKYTVGTSWTIDAVYRETVDEAKQYQKEGVLTVDMETAALFAVAKYRNVEIGAAFSISDSLADLKWRPMFHHEKTAKGLEILFRAALDCLDK